MTDSISSILLEMNYLTRGIGLFPIKGENGKDGIDGKDGKLEDIYAKIKLIPNSHNIKLSCLNSSEFISVHGDNIIKFHKKGKYMVMWNFNYKGSSPHTLNLLFNGFTYLYSCDTDSKTYDGVTMVYADVDTVAKFGLSLIEGKLLDGEIYIQLIV